MTRMTKIAKEAPVAKPRAPGCAAPEAQEKHRVPHPYRDLDRMSRAMMARYTAGVSPFSMLEAWNDWALHLSRAPGRQIELAEKAVQNTFKLTDFAIHKSLNTPVEPPFSPSAYDHRFTSDKWTAMPYALWQQSALATQDWWEDATADLRGVSRANSDRVGFLIRQMLDVFAPSNFPALNPEILDETIKQRGMNLIEGLRHYGEDLLQTLSQTPKKVPEGFEIGKDLAATPGQVIYRNDLFELIQYSPTTETVQAEPVLIVPAWIMKYYILDLSPENSLIRYLVGQGFTVFAISWCNPVAEQADLSLEDYRKRGVMQALDVINAVVPDQKIHATGYCLGGTILSIAAAKMAQLGDTRLASVSLFAAQVDFSEAGELLLFLDESQVAFLEDMMWAQGYLDRPQMSRAFASIRAEDLIYARAVRRYFLGQEDLPSDMLVWNDDTTRMPAKMHSEYLRGLFLENRLTAGRFCVEDRIIALKDISAPIFAVGTEKDHIAPWKSVYKLRLFTETDMSFLLVGGGHNGGIVSEPGHRHAHYRQGHWPKSALYEAPETWRDHTEVQDGSWWPAWIDWLRQQSSGSVAPPAMGAEALGYPPLIAAPGRYIHQR
ncbi:PHA/PHB synthase family protein [Celeribacter neptunius]|uniref:Polyhydroxyalkanoate synthase n=1 Tax=Celeribacter neptunius TaxID=588602 RepID=A0A1I3ILR5_9RHOB|nr:alpha/beta fold hydrolase [Celeribacter neptunius]SFI48876.1 polyhydroxyalkanoate synthase [Celeribacter neptunius]